jgi:uncharacterized protein
VSYPERPAEGVFIADTAKLLESEDAEAIVALCTSLLEEKRVPIIVVTIRSLSKYGASGWSIERYARSLFDAWGIGHPKWNRGMLLLVSRFDRRARIEFGADWAGTKNREAEEVMEELIIPAFKQGDYSRGLLDGVRGLDAIARDLEIPKAPTPWWVYAAWIAFAGLAIFTAVSLVRRGASGWAWLFWGAVFVAIFFLLRTWAESRSSGGGGGSFGGGFGGGGGASGSW